MLRFQNTLSSKAASRQKTLEEKQQLVAKLKEQLDDAQTVLKSEENQLLQYEKAADSAKIVSQQAHNLIVNLTSAINAANKTIARTKQAAEQAMGEITIQKKLVDSARSTVKTLTEQLEKAERSLRVTKIEEDVDSFTVVYADNTSMIDADSESEGVSKESSEISICKRS